MSGWNFYYYEFELTTQASIIRAYRNGGPDILVDFNVWFGTIQTKQYIQLFDYVEDAFLPVTYTLELAKVNNFAPAFTEDVYRINVTESNQAPQSLLQVKSKS